MSKSFSGNGAVSRKLVILRLKRKVTGKMVAKEQAHFLTHQQRLKPYVRAHQSNIFWKDRSYGR